MRKLKKGEFWRALFYCHRMPERSFFFRGHQFPLCARCTGIVVGYAAGIPLLALLPRIPFWITLLMAVPMIIDGIAQNKYGKLSNNPRRFITGVLWGVSAVELLGWYVHFDFWAAHKFLNWLVDLGALPELFRK
ncbi:MAG: DUF2085 domain-containing protein [Oscillospiraceae bacterium]|jgi:uncharacterized membrane protein|nr:DUF2085 domain-containing protein [Oscillospiraceae bacterium]